MFQGNDDFGFPGEDFIGDISAINPASIMDDTFQDDFNLDMNAAASPTKKQKSDQVLDESIILPGDSIVEPRVVEESIVFPDHQRSIIEFEPEVELEGKSLSNNTSKVLNLFKENANDQGKASFFNVTQGGSRAVASKIFFEILVLKSQGVIGVEQGEFFGDISISV